MTRATAYLFAYLALAMLIAFALGGCVTRVSYERTLQDGSKVAASYFSTKAQRWVLGVDPATHLPTVSVNADTPTGWTGRDAGAFAQGILTGAGSAIGAGISAAAGKPPVPLPPAGPPGAASPDSGEGGDPGGDSFVPRSRLQEYLSRRLSPPLELKATEP